MFPFVVPKAFFIQALTALAFSLLAVAFASEENLIGTTELLTPRRDPVVWALATFAVASALSAVFGASPARGLLGTIERRWGALTWVSFLGYYVLLRLYMGGRFWRLALRIVVAVATAVALYGLLRAGGLWPGQQEAVGWARIASTLGNPGYLGACMVLSVALTGYLLVRSEGLAWRALYGTAALVQVSALLGSGTRAAVVGMAVATAVLAALWLAAGGGTKSRRFIAAGTLAIVGAAATLMATTSGDREILSWWDRLLTTISTETNSARFRLVAWGATIQELATNPFFGAGPETFEQVWSRHFDPVMYHVSSTSVLDRAHNVLVHVAITTGSLGLVAYLGIWAGLGRNLLRAWRGGALSGSAASALGFGAIAYFVYLLFWFEDHSSFLLFVVLAGVAGHAASTADISDSETHHGKESGRLSATGSRVHRLAVPALLLSLATLLTWHNVRVLNAARNSWDGEYAMNAWEGAERYQQALAADLPGSEPILQAYLRRLTFLVGHGDSGSPEGPSPRMKEALAAAERAVDGWEAREPENPWVYIRRSRLCSLKEDVYRDGRGRACAREELERAVELSPRRIRYRHWLADHHLSAGDPERALRVLDDALEVYGSFGETYFYRARVHWSTGDRESAVRQSRLATSLGWGGQPSPFVQELAAWLTDEGRPSEAAELAQGHLGLRYAKLRHPNLETEPGQGFQPWDLALAGRLPILHLRAGDPDEAIRAAEFVAHRLASGGDDEGRRERIERFIEDVEAGNPFRWTDETSVVDADPPGDGDSRPTPTGGPGGDPPEAGRRTP